IASMALSTVACAVIISTCGRSEDGIDCESSRISSSPVMPGMTLSTTSRSNAFSWSCFWAPRADVVSTTSCPSSRKARPRRLRIFSSSSARRIEPWIALMVRFPAYQDAERVDGSQVYLWRTERKVDADFRADPALAADGQPAAHPLDDVLGYRQA